MLEKPWPFGKNRVQRASEEALGKVFKESGEALEPLCEPQEHGDPYLLRVEVPGLGPKNPLPKEAKKEGLEARLPKGVLEVRIPREKRPVEPPVKIPSAVRLEEDQGSYPEGGSMLGNPFFFIG